MCNSSAFLSAFLSLDEELLDVSASVLPEWKKETYGQIRMCAKQRLARYGSFNTVQTTEKTERKVSSEPSSPQGGKQGTGPRSTSGVRQLPWESNLGDTQAFSNDLSGPCRFSQQPTLRLPEVKQLLAAKEALTSQCVSVAPRLKLIQSALINWLAMLGPFDRSQKFMTWETTFVLLS